MSRSFDVVCSMIAGLILFPVFIVLGLLVRFRVGSPVLFAQTRTGQGGESFTMYKFRTMTEGAGPDGEPLPDAERLTAFGRTLRSTSLDELPTLWNVLRGDMALVGPRPLLPEYLPLYSAEQMKRHDVLPGVTGWAQVNGRNAISWEDKFRFDVWYVENRSLLLDLRILVMTLQKVVQRDGISADGEATMPKFERSSGPPDSESLA